MRTTLTLDNDVATILERLRKSGKGSFRDLVNEALRQGLRDIGAPPKRIKPYQTREVSLGRCLLGSIDDISEALAAAEGEDFR